MNKLLKNKCFVARSFFFVEQTCVDEMSSMTIDESQQQLMGCCVYVGVFVVFVRAWPLSVSAIWVVFLEVCILHWGPGLASV